MKQLPSAERLWDVLSYDPLKGDFRWLKPTSLRVKAGDLAGVENDGYLFIGIDGHQWGAHRMAVLYMTGAPPVGEVDHWNGVKNDNRYSNLRDGTHQQNMQNEQGPRRNNSTGFLGVSRCPKTKRYRAFISIDGKSKALGRYDTPQAAHVAYVTAKRINHQGNTL